MFSRDEVRVKSWEGGTKELSTEIKVKKQDFDDYEVFNGRVDLTLPMREFRVSDSAASFRSELTDRQPWRWPTSFLSDW
jgi:cell cycle checkpoint control protein RAD9A